MITGSLPIVSLFLAAFAGPADSPRAGRVVGPGAAGAEILAFEQTSDRRASKVLRTRADNAGRFTEPMVIDGTVGARSNWVVVARGGDGGFGWINGYAIPVGDDEPYEIRLRPTGATRGWVVDADGKPLAGAEIELWMFNFVAPNSSPRSMVLPEGLRDDLIVRAAVDGSFALRDVPTDPQIRLRAIVRAAGHSAPRLEWTGAGPATLELLPAGSVAGRLAAPGGVTLEAGWTVNLYAQGPLAGKSTGAYSATTKTDAAGDFRFDEVPPGRFVLSAEPPNPVPLAATRQEGIEVRSAQSTAVEVPINPLLTLRGRVIAAGTDRGVPKAIVRVRHAPPQQRGFGVTATVTTDDDGRFVAFVPVGAILINEVQAERFSLKRESGATPREIDRDAEWPPIVMERSESILLVIKDDDSGRPLPKAEVRVVVPGEFGGDELRALADEGGIARLGPVAPGRQHLIYARSADGQAVSLGAIPVPSTADDVPTEVRIASRHAARATGRVVDSAGRPIAGAKVALSWMKAVPGSDGFIGTTLKTFTTDADGRFQVSGLWALPMPYSFDVTKDGFAPRRGSCFAGVAGAAKDLGNIVLTATSRRVSGRVVDADGKPIGGAITSNTGDAPRRIEATADEQGRFAIEGLFEGKVIIHAQAPGHRLGFAIADASTPEVVVTLDRIEGPPRPAPAPAATREQEVAAVRDWMQQVWDRFGDRRDSGSSQAPKVLAWIDPDQALVWNAAKQYPKDTDIHWAAALARSEADPAGAATLLLEEPDVPVFQLIELGERLLGRDAKAALALAEEGVARARRQEEPDRTGNLAQAAELMIRAGNPAAGELLVLEVLPAANKLGNDGWPAYRRGQVASAVASIDPETAVKLIDPIVIDEHSRFRGWVATRLASLDPERALQVLRTDPARGANRRASMRLQVARIVAPTRPDLAEELITSLDGPGEGWDQIEGAGWLAVGLAARDPARAEGVLLRALKQAGQESQSARSITFVGNPVELGASLTRRAATLGRPDITTAVAWSLAARQPPLPADIGGVGKLADAAWLLALSDPEAARVVLERAEALGANPLGRTTLAAWGLIDRAVAGERVGRLLDAVAGKPDPELQGTGLFLLAETLARPASLREELIISATGASIDPNTRE